MEQTLELETTKEPYVMKMHFESQPEEEIFFHKQAVKSAILLLCLIENVDRIEWTYSVDLAEGPTERHFFCDREEAARLCGVEDLSGECNERDWTRGLMKTNLHRRMGRVTRIFSILSGGFQGKNTMEYSRF